MKQFKISAKNLAQLNMPNTCLRCFSNLLLLRHKTPFNIFPSIFSTFDSLQKALVEGTLEKTGKFPAWLGGMAGAVGLAQTPARMEFLHQGENIVLVGVPDHVLEWEDGTVSPIDYKTSRFTKGQDALKPLYEAQLDAYSYLLDMTSGRKSSRGALVYFEPLGAEAMTLTDKGYVQPWQVNVALIDVSGETALELLGTAREIFEQKIAPDGRAECLDCELLEKLMSVLTKRDLRAHDAMRFMTRQEKAQYIGTANFQRATANLRYPTNTDDMRCQESSLLLTWDWEV